jgi:hypothetical protein
MKLRISFLVVFLLGATTLFGLTSGQLKKYSDFSKSDVSTWTQMNVEAILNQLDSDIRAATKPGTLHNYRNQIEKKWKARLATQTPPPVPPRTQPLPTTPTVTQAPPPVPPRSSVTTTPPPIPPRNILLGQINAAKAALKKTETQTAQTPSMFADLKKTKENLRHVEQYLAETEKDFSSDFQKELRKSVKAREARKALQELITILPPEQLRAIETVLPEPVAQQAILVTNLPSPKKQHAETTILPGAQQAQTGSMPPALSQKGIKTTPPPPVPPRAATTPDLLEQIQAGVPLRRTHTPTPEERQQARTEEVPLVKGFDAHEQAAKAQAAKEEERQRLRGIEGVSPEEWEE